MPTVTRTSEAVYKPRTAAVPRMQQGRPRMNAARIPAIAGVDAAVERMLRGMDIAPLPPSEAKSERGIAVATAAAILAHDDAANSTAAATAVLLAPPPPTSAAPVRTCTICRAGIGPHEDYVVRGTCLHVNHGTCFARMIRAGRQFCSECPVPGLHPDTADQHGGYVVDAGGDTDIRAAMIDALEYRAARASFR